jgi:D-xylose transport system permease protein
LRSDLGFLPVLVTLIIIVVYFAITTDGIFLSPRNFSELVQEIATIGLLSLGSTFVLLIGEIDLSLVSVSILCSVVMAVLSERAGQPAWVAIAAALLTGALIGFVNGIFVAVLRVPSFIVTLAGSIAYAGLLLTLLAGQSTLIIRNDFILSIAGTPTSFLTDTLGIGLPTLVLLVYLGAVMFNYVRRKRAALVTMPLLQFALQIVLVVVLVEGAVVLFESYFGIPNSTAILFALILLFWLILTKTRFGRHVYAVGGNAEAARRAGINVVAIRIALFTLCSLLAAIGGVVAASRATAVASQINPTLLLDAIAAAVIGGVSLFGGRGSVWSIVLGVLIIGSLENGLTLKSQPVNVKEMIEGAVLAIAVTVDAILRRLQARSGR